MFELQGTGSCCNSGLYSSFTSVQALFFGLIAAVRMGVFAKVSDVRAYSYGRHNL